MNIENILVKDAIISCARTYLKENGFIEVFPTRVGTYAIVNSDMHVERLFNFKYYNNEEYFLSQTAQNMLEKYTSKLNKCFSITPCYRRESKSHSQSLSEFWSIEAEWCGESIDSIKSIVTGMFNYIFENLKGNERFRNLNIDWLHSPFESFSYNQYISRKNSKKEIEKPSFITNYPIDIQDWTMDRLAPNSELSKDICLVYPLEDLQILFGGVRSIDIEDILARFKKASQMLSCFNEDELFQSHGWYFNFKKEMRKRTCGFGLGVERLMMCLFDKNNILDVCDFNEPLFVRKLH